MAGMPPELPVKKSTTLLHCHYKQVVGPDQQVQKMIFTLMKNARTVELKMGGTEFLIPWQSEDKEIMNSYRGALIINEYFSHGPVLLN